MFVFSPSPSCSFPVACCQVWDDFSPSPIRCFFSHDVEKGESSSFSLSLELLENGLPLNMGWGIIVKDACSSPGFLHYGRCPIGNILTQK